MLDLRLVTVSFDAGSGTGTFPAEPLAAVSEGCTCVTWAISWSSASATRLPGFLARRLDLKLNEGRSRIMPVRDGAPFLGLRVFPRLIRPGAERWQRFRRRHREVEAALAAGQIDEAGGGPFSEGET